jgi:hypothetical protein
MMLLDGEEIMKKIKRQGELVTAALSSHPQKHEGTPELKNQTKYVLALVASLRTTLLKIKWCHDPEHRIWKGTIFNLI